MDQLLMGARDRRRDERGAYAIVFALLATVLFGVAALAVDLGNLYQRKAETQSQADLAALSSTAGLAKSQQAAVAAVANYLNRNLKQGQTQVTIGQLQDANSANGEVTFPSPYMMRVVTPGARVTFGLSAPLQTSNSTDVTSAATVGVGTPGIDKTLPFYAVTGSGCDYGSQALSDPANGQHQSVVPVLAPPQSNSGQTSNASLDSLTPYQFALGSSPAIITTIFGSHLSSVSKIGFFRPPTDAPNAVEQVIVTNTNNNTISGVQIPPQVVNSAGIWWLRTYTSSGNKGWSPLDQSLPIRIGDGPIACGNLSNSGNFGSLKLPRSTPVSTWMPDNIAAGLQTPLSLSVQTSSASIPSCYPGGPNVIYSPTTGSGTRYPNTNCVDTDTGLTAQPVTDGMITGTGSGYPGRLVRPTTDQPLPGRHCGVGHSTAERTMLGKDLNDDTLTCFMNIASQKLSEIASPTYSGPPALDKAIYDSPRFCYVPVLGIDPSSGGSDHYSVVDVRPCFITSESVDSTYNNQLFTDGTVSTTTNGLTIPTTKVTSMRVFFFNKKALPNEGAAKPGVVLSPDGPLVGILVD